MDESKPAAKAEAGAKLEDDIASVANAITVATVGVVWGMALRPGAVPLPPVVLVLGVGSTEFGPYGRMFLGNWLAGRSRDAAMALDRIWERIAHDFHYVPGLFGGKPDQAKLNEIGVELVKQLARCWPSAPKLAVLLKSGSPPKELARFVATKLGEARPLFRPGGAGELGHRFALQVIESAMEQALAEQKHFVGVEPYELFKDLDLGMVLAPAIFDADHAETLAPAIARLVPMLNASGLDYGLKYNEALKIGREALKLGDDGKLDEAEAKFKQAGAIFEAIGDRGEVGNVYMNLGVIEEQRQHPDIAVSHYKEALARFEGRGIENKIAAALQSLGKLEAARENYAAAAGFYEQALTHCLPAAREALMGLRDAALMEVEYAKQNYAQAEQHARAALKLHPSYGVAIRLYDKLSLILVDAENFDGAAEVLKAALALAEEKTDKQSCAVMLYSLGAAEFCRDNKAEACRCLKRSHDLFAETGDAISVERVINMLEKCDCT